MPEQELFLPPPIPDNFITRAAAAAGSTPLAVRRVDLGVKPTCPNPKQAIGDTKMPLGQVPDTLVLYASTAFAEGALKYGRWNWRVAGVLASTYVSACRRHIAKWWNGEEYDPKTKVHHLANAIACLGIILDAQVCGKLTDDRPPAVDLNNTIESLEATLAHLKELHKDCNPKHFSELDK